MLSQKIIKVILQKYLLIFNHNSFSAIVDVNLTSGGEKFQFQAIFHRMDFGKIYSL